MNQFTNGWIRVHCTDRFSYTWMISRILNKKRINLYTNERWWHKIKRGSTTNKCIILQNKLHFDLLLMLDSNVTIHFHFGWISVFFFSHLFNPFIYVCNLSKHNTYHHKVDIFPLMLSHRHKTVKLIFTYIFTCLLRNYPAITYIYLSLITQVKNTSNGNGKSYLPPPTSYPTITTFSPLEGDTECQL